MTSIEEKNGNIDTIPRNEDPALIRRPEDVDDLLLTGGKSPGVLRVEAIAAHFTLVDKVFFWISILLVSYVYTLDDTIRYTYSSYATASFNNIGQLSTINVARSVIAAAAQPTAAKIADVFGRVELIGLSVVFYVVGTIMQAAAPNFGTFAGGTIIYQIGFTLISFLLQVLISDLTSTRSRLLGIFIPVTPFLINTWVSGNITSAVLGVTTWRWGYGMFGIIYPVSILPLFITLTIVHRRAKKAGALINYQSPYKRMGFVRLCKALFWQLDVIGLLLMIAVFALILIPFTIAGGVSTTWRTAKVIATLVVGFCCVPFFILWETKTKHPLVPFHLLKDRGVWAAIGIAVMLDFVWYMQGDYLYSILLINFNESIKSATRISGLYTFVSTLTGFLLGFVVIGVRRLKPFIFLGTILFMVAFGLLIRFRGSPDAAGHSGVIGAQVVLGMGGGLFSYPTQASAQAATRHEHLAVVTGIYLALYNIGSAFGATVSGAVYTNVLPAQLVQRLGNVTLATSVYGDPYTFIASNPIGSVERSEVIAAYAHTQKILCTVGICLCIPLIMFSLFLRNPQLTKDQSLPNAERDTASLSSQDSLQKEKKKWYQSIF